VKELKRLQDNLGSFHDACVQARALREVARDLGRLGGSHLETLVSLVETLVSVGRLVERAEARKAAERAAFEKRFARFDAPKTHGRFRQLFGSAKHSRQHAVAHQTPSDGRRARGGDEAEASSETRAQAERL
jgi:hypothetical protein